MVKSSPVLPHPSHVHQPRGSILVLGSGVIGLTAGIVLQRRGFKVDIWAKDLPPNTTSNKAGAYWFPYNVQPMARVNKWAADTYKVYQDILSKDPQAGVIPAPFVDFFDHPRPERFFYEDFIPFFRRAKPDELPAGFVDGIVLQTFSINVDKALNYFIRIFLRSGGRLRRKTVNNISEAFSSYDYVINCTGLGSIELFNDSRLFPARGQTVITRLQKNTLPNQPKKEGQEDWYNCVTGIHTDSVLAYIIPRDVDVVLGGTYQKGNSSLLVSEEDTNEILKKCALACPLFERDKIQILQEKVGLRPCRDEVRLEGEFFENGKKLVIHNYAHGGAGWSICFGCAFEVVEILEKAINSNRSKL